MYYNFKNSNIKNDLNIGDIIKLKLNLSLSNYILIIGIYISPNKSINEIKKFIMYNLKEIIENEISVMLCGYFNLNIRKKNNYEFINFMSENLNMKLITN